MRKIPISPIAAVAFFGICGSLAAQIRPSNDLTEKEISVLQQLAKQQYFKDATCAQFANILLAEQALPLIGKMTPAPPLRNNVDRRHESDRLPILVDGATIREKPLLDVNIATDSANGRTQWTLELSRKLDVLRSEDPKIKRTTRLETKTTYFFSVEEKANHPDCELQKIAFEARSPGAGLAFNRDYTTKSCVDLFLDGASRPLMSRPLGLRALSFAEKDCATGIHYFAEAKYILSQRKLGLKK